MKSLAILRGSYHHYETITLKTFIEVANSGDLRPLLIKGRYDHEEAVEKWERIIQLNAKANGSFNFDQYFYLYKSYLLLVAKHTKVRALLWRLAHNPIDYTVVQEVRECGYKVDMTNSITLAQSVERAFRQSDNLITKYNSKKNELDRLTGSEQKEEGPKETFDDIWAALSLAVAPMIIQDDIRLSQYNALKKRIEKQSKARKNGVKHG